MPNDVRVKGYAWALSQALHSDYNDFTSWRAFAQACLKGTSLADAVAGDEAVYELWTAWEQGADDARVFLRDDFMSVAEIASRTGFNISYIKAEIKRYKDTKGDKGLYGQKIGNSYVVFPDDFRKWLANPKRGSRTKKTPQD